MFHFLPHRSILCKFGVLLFCFMSSLSLFSTPMFFYISVRRDVNDKNGVVFCFEKKRKIDTLVVEGHIPGTANDWKKVWEIKGPLRASCVNYGQAATNTIVQSTRLESNVRYRIVITGEAFSFWGSPETLGWTEFKFTQSGELIVAGPHDPVEGWEDL